MIAHNPHRRTPGARWQPPAQRITHQQGTITSSVRGSRVNVTVKLSRIGAVMLGAGDKDEFQATYALLLRIWKWFDCAYKAGVCFAVLFFAYEIGKAFLPGGAIYRIFGGEW